MGGRKLQSIRQFLTENVMICQAAAFLAFVLVKSTLLLVDGQTGRELQFNVAENLVLMIGLLLTPLIIALLAGLYPALYISSFEPVGI